MNTRTFRTPKQLGDLFRGAFNIGRLKGEILQNGRCHECQSSYFCGFDDAQVSHVAYEHIERRIRLLVMDRHE